MEGSLQLNSENFPDARQGHFQGKWLSGGGARLNAAEGEEAAPRLGARREGGNFFPGIKFRRNASRVPSFSSFPFLFARERAATRRNQMVTRTLMIFFVARRTRAGN